jgi:hypothetical protein
MASNPEAPGISSKSSFDGEKPRDASPTPSEKREIDKDVEAQPNIEHNEPAIRANPREGISTWRWILVILSLDLAAMLYGLDTTIAADVQASVYESLGDIENLPW